MAPEVCCFCHGSGKYGFSACTWCTHASASALADDRQKGTNLCEQSATKCPFCNDSGKSGFSYCTWCRHKAVPGNEDYDADCDTDYDSNSEEEVDHSSLDDREYYELETPQIVSEEMKCKACDGRGITGIIPGWDGAGIKSGTCRQCEGSGSIQGRPNRTPAVHLARAGAAAAAGCGLILGVVALGAHGPRLFQELKDGSLSSQGKYAAMAKAAYEETPSKAMSVAHANGILSRNWVVDETLSDEHHKIFFNTLTKEAVVAMRGTNEWCDWIKTNIPIIVAGREKNSSRFAASIELTKKVVETYGKSQVSVTGHSLGGGLADYVGRRVGLPSVQFNPGIVGRACWGETTPAVNSTSYVTLEDIVSRVHQFKPGDTTIQTCPTTVNTGSYQVVDGHNMSNFVQSRSSTDSFPANRAFASNIVKRASISAAVGATAAGLAANVMVNEESRMGIGELSSHIQTGQLVGTLSGGAASLGTAAVASIPVAVPAAEAAAATTTLASAAGFTVAGAASAVVAPVAAVAAATYVVKQFGKVPLTLVLEAWFAKQSRGDWIGSLLVCGSVRNDCDFITKMKNGSRWKGLTVPSGALAFRSNGLLDHALLMTPYSRMCAIESDRAYLGEVSVNGHEFKIYRCRR